ncbi:MAG: FeoC-like transcriptional regulator [Fibrobacterota bacterium]
MDVRRVRNILRERQSLTLSQLAALSNQPTQSLLPILLEWEARGKIKRETTPSSLCPGTCSCTEKTASFCNPENDPLFIWITEAPK